MLTEPGGKPPLPTKAELPILKRDDYPNVHFWTEKQYSDFKASQSTGDTDTTSTTKKRPGRPRKSNKADNSSYLWIETEDGSPVDSIRLSAMSTKLTQILNTLFNAQRAANSWGGNNDTSTEFVLRAISHEFIEFRFANNYWKAEKWITKKYPGWARDQFDVDNPRK